MNKPTPYPLSWPANVPRTERKAASQFKTGLTGAMKNVKESLRLFGNDTGQAVSEILISSNVTLGNERPQDAGVAVWFVWKGAGRCIAVDRYGKVEENLQAIHHILEARRTEARHGGIVIAEQTFAGFTPALPSKPSRVWRTVLGVGQGASRAEAEARYRDLAKSRHPDTSKGSHEAMAELNAAIDEAREELGG